MNAFLQQLRQLLASRSPRERLLLGVAGVMLAGAALHVLLVAPLQGRIAVVEAEIARAEMALTRATRMSADARRLQGELGAVEARIKPGARTNLFTLLETLAAQAEVKDQLESIKPKPASGSERYPETRVEVSLKGATLAQTVQFLYRIEMAPSHLIIRSIRMKARGNDATLLDVSFSVSSFERA